MPKKWTEEEERYLEEHYGEVPNKVLAEKFDVSTKAISDKMRSMRKKKEDQVELGSEPLKGQDEEADIEIISAGFYIRTEEGWKQLSIKKARD